MVIFLNIKVKNIYKISSYRKSTVVKLYLTKWYKFKQLKKL